MRVTISHREERAGFGLGKKRYFVDAQIDFTADEMAIVHAKKLDKRHLISGGEFKGEFSVSAFMNKTMPVRFTDYYEAQDFAAKFREQVKALKSYIDEGALPANRTDSFEL